MGIVGGLADRRKLIAVVYADMAGYSRLIGLDDVGTLNRLRTLRREIIDPAIEELPAAMREEVLRTRDTDAGRFALRMFSQERARVPAR